MFYQLLKWPVFITSLLGKPVKTENVVAHHSRALPAPVAIKANSDNGAFDVVLGETTIMEPQQT